jgi:hypothetical protein
MADPRPVDETIAALTFPQHTYPNVYLHTERVEQAFIGNLGAISEFSRSAERALGGGAEVSAVFAKAGVHGDRKTSADVKINMEVPLARALVIRSYLSQAGGLATDVKSAKVMSYVIARGRGGVAYPSQDGQWKASIAAWVPAEIADEVLAEHAQRLGIRRTDDSHPEYWPSFALTPTRISVALLGGRELNHSNSVNWIGAEVTCCIFGIKVRDWLNWTLIMPFHVWYEPPNT